MDLKSLYGKIVETTAHVLVLRNGEVISKGSGFCFRPTGEILTAAHTVAGGFPIRESDLIGQGRTIVVRLPYQQKPPLLYKPTIWPFEIHANFAGMKPLQLDIAILAPLEKQTVGFNYLPPSNNPPELGEEMYFGGYSDEIEFPFDVDRLIDPTIVNMDELRREYAYDTKRVASGPMIKRGTVGNARVITAKSALLELKTTAFYMDNQIHSGASGGPIVSSDGNSRGIIVKRAMTTTSADGSTSLPIPSGSTMGISLDVINFVTSLSTVPKSPIRF